MPISGIYGMTQFIEKEDTGPGIPEIRYPFQGREFFLQVQADQLGRMRRTCSKDIFYIFGPDNFAGFP